MKPSHQVKSLFREELSAHESGTGLLFCQSGQGQSFGSLQVLVLLARRFLILGFIAVERRQHRREPETISQA